MRACWGGGSWANSREAGAHLERDGAVLLTIRPIHRPWEGALLHLDVVLAHGVLGSHDVHIHLQGKMDPVMT